MSQLRVVVTHRLRVRMLGPQLVLLLLVGLAGCGPQPPPIPVPAPPGVTSLHVFRTSAFPLNYIPPFEQTVDDATKVLRLYTTLHALPTPPPGPIFCPLDFGVAYHLRFSLVGTTVLLATIEESGCRFATLSTGEQRWAYSDTFWTVFADTLDVPESELVPRPR